MLPDSKKRRNSLERQTLKQAMGKIRRYDLTGAFKEEDAMIDFKVDFTEHKAKKVLKRSTSQRPDKGMPTKELTLKPLKRPDEEDESPEDAQNKAGGE